MLKTNESLLHVLLPWGATRKARGPWPAIQSPRPAARLFIPPARDLGNLFILWHRWLNS